MGNKGQVWCLEKAACLRWHHSLPNPFTESKNPAGPRLTSPPQVCASYLILSLPLLLGGVHCLRTLWASLLTTEPLLGLVTSLRGRNTLSPLSNSPPHQVSPLTFSPCLILGPFMHAALCLEHSSSLWSQSEDPLLQEAFLDSLDRVCTFYLHAPSRHPVILLTP